MYGFHKITEAGVQSDGSAYEFGHTSFKRGHPHLIQDIRRKTTKPSNTTVAAAESSKEKTANDASRESLEKYHKVTQETLNRLCGTVEQLQMRLEQMHERLVYFMFA